MIADVTTAQCQRRPDAFEIQGPLLDRQAVGTVDDKAKLMIGKTKHGFTHHARVDLIEQRAGGRFDKIAR